MNLLSKKFYLFLCLFLCMTTTALFAHEESSSQGHKQESSHHKKNKKKKRIRAKKIKADQITTDELIVKKVINNIGKTYVVGVDVPTIQAGIDLASSGLKPDAANPDQLLQAGAKNVTLSIPAGTYHETLFIDTSLSDPTINDPGTDLFFLQGRGLRLIGDTRPIAAMTYINGGLVRTSPVFLANLGLNSLGTLNSVVTLTNSGNTLIVSLATGNNPNFGAAGVVAGDTIIVSDVDGNFQERTVQSVNGNTVTYLGTSVTISGKGAALTFCPNVHVVASIPDAICYVVSGAVEMVGIWFSMDPAFDTTSLYGIAAENTGIIYGSQILGDGRHLNIGQITFFTFAGGQIFVNLADGNISSHMTSIAGRIEIGANSGIRQGDWYSLARLNQSIACVFHLAGSQMLVNSIQVNGANGTTGGYVTGNECLAQTAVFTAFNCTNGFQVTPRSNTVITSLVTISNCVRGVAITNGSFSNTAAAPFAGLTSTISNCQIGILANLRGEFSTSVPLILSNDTTVGIQLTNGSTFVSSNNVTFTGVTNPYAIDEGSIYTTDNNIAGTDASPSNIFTYSAPGSFAMNSAYLHQLLDSAGVVNLTLNPGATVANTRIYRGKIYTLTKTSGGNHTLTLVGATFLDGTTTKTFSGPVGSTMTIEIIDDTRVAILSSTGVF
jgi:hypothetical protein